MADINQAEKYVNMTDLNEPLSRGRKGGGAKRGEGPTAGGKGTPLPEVKLHEFAELLFFAYRDFTGDPDAILKDFGFGRAHHRVLHFVNRHSGLRVADLMDIHNNNKQTKTPVLNHMIEKGYD
jgi:hypothetical protein